MREIPVGSFGFKIRVSTSTDLTGYTQLQQKIEKPDGTVLTKGASTPDPTGGYIEYVVESGVFSAEGDYTVQAIATFTGKCLKTKCLPLPPVVRSLA